MALQTSGPISLNDIHVEAGGTSGTTVSMNDTDIRDLIGKGSGATMSFSEWYGASAFNFTNTLVRTINNPNTYGTSANDQLGRTGVRVAGNYIVAATMFEDSAAANDSGVVYVYNRSTGALIHTITNPNAGGGSAADRFAYAMDTDGTNLIIGAYYDAGGANFSGKAYIYSLSSGSLIHTLSNPNAYSSEYGDQFGYSVAIDGSYAIVGAWLEESTSTGATDSGAAYIFNTSTGNLVHTLSNPNAAVREWFGTWVEISGNYAAVTAPFYTNSTSADPNYRSGRVYVYNVSTGSLVYTLNDPNAYGTAIGDLLGYLGGVRMTDKYLAVSAYAEDDAGNYQSGAGYVFDLSNGNLLKTFTNPNNYGTTAYDEFGQSVALDGDHVVFSSKNEDDASNLGTGVAYLFNIPSGQLVATITNPNAFGTAAGDGFGWTVDMDGSTIVGSAPGEDETSYSSAGKVYVFE